MVTSWPEMPFGELYAVPSKNGLTRPKAIRGTGVPMVNMGELFAYDRILNPDMEKVPVSAKESESFLLEAGDLLFARSSLTLAGAGKVSIVLPWHEPRTFESHIIRVRCNRDIAIPEFYYYLFKSSVGRDLINSIVEQVAAAGIRGSDLAKIRVPVPPIRIQQAIAAILSALDGKIDLNQKMNQTLEEIAQAIFKSWFIDFDPVRYRASGQQSPGLAPHITDLFPEKLRKTDMGELPDGWHSTNLSDIVHVNPPRKVPKGTLATYLDMANMPTQGPSPLFWTKRHFSTGMKFINGDTLVARITPCLENGKTAFIDFLNKNETGWGSTEYLVLRPHDPIPPVFAYLLARNNSFRSYAIQQMSGSSGRQRVQAQSISMFKVCVPNKEHKIFDVFGKAVDSLFDKISNNMQQIRTLADIRDTLLPQLVSGKLRVPDAERIASRYL